MAVCSESNLASPARACPVQLRSSLVRTSAAKISCSEALAAAFLKLLFLVFGMVFKIW